MINDVLIDAEDRMKKSAGSKQHEFATIRTGRATPSLLSNIKVSYYGSIVPLKQVANVAAPDPRLLVVQVFDKNAVSEVDKAIRAADLGLNPQIEGNLLRLPVPQLNEERRKDLVKYAHKIAEEGKVAIRNIRRDCNEMLKELQKDKEISEDQEHTALDKIQKLTDKYIIAMDEMYKNKEIEILEE